MVQVLKKTTENTFRDLQISAVNQLALYCEAMGINVYDVRAGVGGHCLTRDTYHLERGSSLQELCPGIFGT